MKVVILAGGVGSRLSEETQLKPKPMVEIGPHPILWHIMKHYSFYGLNDFIICLGYKGYVIKEYFANYVLHRSDVVVDVAQNRIDYLGSQDLPPWRVALVDTGAETMTGGRLKRVAPHLLPGEPFCMTYGDGISDVDLTSLIDFHNKTGLDATLTAVRPPGRFGATLIEGNRVKRFMEKPLGDGGHINGGFFVLHPRVIDRIKDDATTWEGAPLESLARDGQLAAYIHDGFWHPMDTLRDRQYLEHLWSGGAAPWKIWT
ncbi:MAG TPA: glucose-1-phosphate cytidylyltransferase [Pseudolabrys sp.]|nr:glucose-1-phosphate cytidylyltransferase [Pseudolabrys sp.]